MAKNTIELVVHVSWWVYPFIFLCKVVSDFADISEKKVTDFAMKGVRVKVVK